MSSLRRVGIAGTGSYVPERRLTNFDLEKIVDTSDEWIRERTGIIERRVVENGTVTSDLAKEASERALAKASLKPGDIDLIILATITPDTTLPATACHLQRKIGAEKAGAFDVAAACSGFINALVIGWQFVRNRTYDHVLVVGAETLSAFTDYKDRNTCVLFGDGAGAVVLSPDAPQGEILSGFLRTDGSGAEMMYIPGGGAKLPASHETVKKRLHFMKIRGREVFKFAVNKMAELVAQAIEENGGNYDDLGIIIPHQVNIRIIDAALKKLNLPKDKVYLNIQRYGNTSAASVPIALDEAIQDNRIAKGKYVVFVAFGGGLTWASCLARW